MDNTLPHTDELKTLLPEPITGSQSAVEQTKNVQTQLQQPIISKVEDTKTPTNINKPNNNVPKEPQQHITKMKYNKTLFIINLICTLLVLVGALNWGAHVLNINLVELLSNLLNSLITLASGKNYNIRFNIVIYSLVFSSAIILASQKSTWLPFLGSSVLPASLVPLKTPINNNQSVIVNTKPNTKVAYWAALPSKNNTIPFVIDAYGDYSNAGVVISDDTGVAVLPILEGSGYYVPGGKELKRHVHWRLIHDNGMMGPVRTQSY